MIEKSKKIEAKVLCFQQK